MTKIKWKKVRSATIVDWMKHHIERHEAFAESLRIQKAELKRQSVIMKEK